MTSLAHATIVMERTYSAAAARVFAAWSDIEARKRWSAPADDIRIEYEAADFREGGRDVSRCIEPNNDDYVATVYYLDIRKAERDFGWKPKVGVKAGVAAVEDDGIDD